MVRLDRFLSEESVCSRSVGKKLIRSGRVSVNGIVSGDPELKIDPSSDEVSVDGKTVTPAGRVCLMMNKPAGYISAVRDRTQKTVTDLVREPYADRLFPVGRLDKDTEGLLLLTNDGQLSHSLTSPARHVQKTYFTVISGEPSDDLAEEFLAGIDIGERRKTLPSLLVFPTVDGDFLEKGRRDGMVPDKMIQEFCLKGIALSDYARCGSDECCAAVSVTEGKYHQIKRMFHAVGREVHYLKRISVGCLMLDPAIKPGEYRRLPEKEISMLTEKWDARQTGRES